MNSNLPAQDPKRFSKKLSRKTVLFIICGILVSAGVSIYILFFTGPSSWPPLQNLKNIVQKEPTVAPKTAFKNPFAKESQFVNPFDTYKSPFYGLKAKAAAETK